LAHAPKLDDPVALEFEDVDHSRSQVLWFLSHAGVNRHQIAVFESALDLQDLVRIFGRVFLHRYHQ
jgi:hypothetical protein